MLRYHPNDPRSSLEGYEGSLTQDEEVSSRGLSRCAAGWNVFQCSLTLMYMPMLPLMYMPMFRLLACWGAIYHACGQHAGSVTLYMWRCWYA